MNYKPPLNKAFFMVLAVLIAGWFWQSYSTRGAPAWDGQQLYGFPLPYSGWGGFCMDGGCGWFSTPLLVVDLLILIGLPWLVGGLFRRYRARRQKAE